MRKGTKIFVCVALVLVALMSPLAVFAADYGNVGTDTATPIWFGIPVESIRVDCYSTIPNFINGSWNTDTNSYDNQSPDLTYTVGMPKGILPNSIYTPIAGSSENVSNVNVEYQNGYTFNYLPVTSTIRARLYQGSPIIDFFLNSTIVSGLNTSTMDGWSTKITLNAGAFRVSTSMDADRLLHVIPFSTPTGSLSGESPLVKYTYTKVRRITRMDGTYQLDTPTRTTEYAYTTWEDGLSVCPPSIAFEVTNSPQSSIFQEWLIDDLQVTVYNVPPTGQADPQTGYAPLNVAFTGYNGEFALVRDYSDGDFDVLTEYEDLRASVEAEEPGLLDWLIDSVDAFMSFEIADGISFYVIFGIIAGIGILMMLLKMFAGG